MLGVVGTAGLSFDGSFQARSLVVTAPVALMAAFVGARAPRGWSPLLVGPASAAFAIETNTAYANHDGCIGAEVIYREASISAPFGQCSQIGLWATALATLTSLIAGILIIGEGEMFRKGITWVGGVVLAPLVLYLLSVAAFVLGRG